MAETKHLTETRTKSTASSALTESSMTIEEVAGLHYSDELIMFEKKSISDHINNVLHVPLYLSSTIDNKFERMVQEQIYPMANFVKVEKLRFIAILIYKLYVLDWEKSLWNHYLKAGTGLLRSHESHLKICPEDVQTKVKSALRLTINTDSTHIQMNDHYYLRFIQEHLRKFNDKQEQLRQQLSQKKTWFYPYTNQIETIIETFIQEHIEPLRLEYEYEMTSVEFEYRERVFEYALEQQNHTTEQIEMIKQLVDRKHSHEQIEQQVAWIRQYINDHRLQQILRSVQLSFPSSIQPLMNMDLHQRLSHHRISPRYKQEMIATLIDTIETTSQESQKLFEEELEKMWENQNQVPKDHRLNSTMIGLIEQHLLAIADKVRHVYDFQKNVMSLF